VNAFGDNESEFYVWSEASPLNMLGCVNSTTHSWRSFGIWKSLLLLHCWKGWHVFSFAISSYCSLSLRENFQISFYTTFIAFRLKFLLFCISLCSILCSWTYQKFWCTIKLLHQFGEGFVLIQHTYWLEKLIEIKIGTVEMNTRPK
jgi:hypothetical protein